MLQILVITLRESIEAFLIVAISLAYLRKVGRHQLVSAVHTGVFAGLLTSLVVGMLLFNVTPQELAATHAALVAGIENHTLRPLVGHEFSLDDAARAHDMSACMTKVLV